MTHLDLELEWVVVCAEAQVRIEQLQHLLDKPMIGDL